MHGFVCWLYKSYEVLYIMPEGAVIIFNRGGRGFDRNDV